MIPVSTDAPIYHYPIATVTTIVLNVVMFLAFCQSPMFLLMDDQGNTYNLTDLEQHVEQLESDDDRAAFMQSLRPADGHDDLYRSLSVEFGKVKPWQWVTNNYMHSGWMHLIGNMIFLWAFGIIVEGKVGWFWFTLIYLGIGSLYGMVLQLGAWALGMDYGIALGASAAIFGLLALCVAWAPANEFTVLWLFGFRGGFIEISILMFGAFYFFKELLYLGLRGFQMSSELLHVLGFIVAMPIGLYLVRAGYVDCEGWDIFSYLHGTTGSESKVHINYERARDRRAGLATESAAAQPKEQPAQPVPPTVLQAQVAEALDQGNFDLAIKLQQRLSHGHGGLNWRAQDLYRVISGLLKARRNAEALPLIQTYVESFEERRFAMEVAMIKIWLQQRRPRQALKYMEGMNLAFYTPEQAARIEPLVEQARRLIAPGAVEWEGDVDQ